MRDHMISGDLFSSLMAERWTQALHLSSLCLAKLCLSEGKDSLPYQKPESWAHPLIRALCLKHIFFLCLTHYPESHSYPCHKKAQMHGIYSPDPSLICTQCTKEAEKQNYLKRRADLRLFQSNMWLCSYIHPTCAYGLQSIPRLASIGIFLCPYGVPNRDDQKTQQ